MPMSGQASCLITLSPVALRQVLFLNWAGSLLVWLGWLTSELLGSACLSPPIMGSQVCQPRMAFYMGDGDSNSGPNVW